MSKKKRNPFNIQLDVDEQEIENALPESWDKLSMTKNLEEELDLAKKAAANYLKKKEEITQAFGMYRVRKKISLKDIQKAIEEGPASKKLTSEKKRTVWN